MQQGPAHDTNSSNYSLTSHYPAYINEALAKRQHRSECGQIEQSFEPFITTLMGGFVTLVSGGSKFFERGRVSALDKNAMSWRPKQSHQPSYSSLSYLPSHTLHYHCIIIALS